MNEPVTRSLPSSEKLEKASEKLEKVELSIHLDPDLLDQIKHLTNDPSKVIEVAIRHWLRSEISREGELSRNLQRNPPVPPRGEWND